MSKNTKYNVRINSSILQQADILYKNMGLTLSSAINLHLTKHYTLLENGALCFLI